MENQIADYFKLLQLSPSLVEEVFQRAKDILAETHNDVDRERIKLLNENTRLEKQKQVLEVKFLDGLVLDEMYSSHHVRISDELASNKLRLEKISEERDTNIDLFESFLRLARNLTKAYTDSKPSVKMAYLSIFWEHFEIKDRRISKAVPSQIVSALINEGLITLNKKSSSDQVLIKFLWLPRLGSNQ